MIVPTNTQYLILSTPFPLQSEPQTEEAKMQQHAQDSFKIFGETEQAPRATRAAPSGL